MFFLGFYDNILLEGTVCNNKYLLGIHHNTLKSIFGKKLVVDVLA